MTSNIITDLTNLVPGTFYRIKITQLCYYYMVPCDKQGIYNKDIRERQQLKQLDDNIILFISLKCPLNYKLYDIVFFDIKRNMFACMPNCPIRQDSHALSFEEI